MGMKEEFLQYIWANSLYKSRELVTVSGKKIYILQPGSYNRDAGPDFFNARIRMEGVELAGNIEVHLQNSDWFRHKHHLDAAYNNVILSVVKKADVRIYNKSGREIETVELNYAEPLYEEYLYIQGRTQRPGCRERLRRIDPTWFYFQLPPLAIERLERKCGDIQKMLDQTHNDWQECFYRLLCKYWAGNVNSEPFYELSLHLPYKILLRHADRQLVLEALLFGCSGLLEQTETDTYTDALKAEYRYLQAKYKLEPLNASQWKFMRIRPGAFPTVRLALLAAFLKKWDRLLPEVLDTSSLKDAKSLLDVRASGYWNTHFTWTIPSSNRPKRMGQMIKNILIINAIIPFMFLYGKKQGKENYCRKAVRWLEELPAERNYIIQNWEMTGLRFDSAMQTQALIQLRREYCDKHRCLECRIGREILKSIP